MSAVTSKNTTWRKVKLTDVADVDWGDTNTTKSSYKAEGYLAFSATGPDGLMDHYDFDREAIILSAIGANCGQTWFTQGKWSSIKNTIHIWGKEGLADTKFLFYLTRNPKIWPQRGSAQPFISKGDAERMEISIPDEIEDQRRIAAVVSSFDSKIKNNNRIIKILEEIAQTIFTEWFMKFRFPGYEKAEFVESELGRIPEGWEVVQIEKLVKRVSAGKKFDQKTALLAGKVPILDQGKSGIIGFHNEEPGVFASEKDPIIVFANHTCYENLVMYPFSAIQNVLPFKPSSGYHRSIYWLFFATKDLVKFNDYKGHWPELMSRRIIVPPNVETETFKNLIGPMIIKKYSCEKENIALGTARDLLLPKLMSGKVRV